MHPSSAFRRTQTAFTKADPQTALRAFRQIVKSRVSARRFEPNVAVPDHVWRDVLRMTLRSPSGFNLQPTHLLLVRSPRLKSTLSRHAMLGFGNQYRTTDASAVAIFCSDLEPSKRVDRVYDMERKGGVREDGYMAVLRVAASFLTGEGSTHSPIMNGGSGSSTHFSTFLKQTFVSALSPVQPMPTMEHVESWSYKNAGIMAQMYTLAATAHGLSTCMMEGYDSRRVKEILQIPDRYGVPLMVATGYDYGAPPMSHANCSLDEDSKTWDDDVELHSLDEKPVTPRLEMNEIFFGDTFGEPLNLLVNEADRVKENVV
mmetsp:Transcript_9769/g.18954  ORF Transcript_9769/g.18954 Transcript_9769/m.18954 type:complete len:316 (+) Transcript_9769:48-995(+)